MTHHQIRDQTFSGDIDMEEADRAMLEALALGLVAVDVRQARDAVPFEAKVQR